MSMGDYYELDGEDNKFGYFSIAGIVTVPLGGTTKFGAWNLHFGAEYQKLGDTTKAFNGGREQPVHRLGRVRILLLSRPGGVDGRIGPGPAGGRRSLRGRAVS